MAENDIYNSEQHWKTIVKKIKCRAYLKEDNKTRYYIKNKDNLKYFNKLIKEFEAKDISFIRRIAHFKALRKVCYFTTNDIKKLTRDNVTDMIAELNKVHKSINSRRDFVNYNKYIWKILFPEPDNKGRPDDTVIPYAWRIKVHNDKSKQKKREDKLTDTEYIKIMKALNRDPRMQLFTSLHFSNLARPQEICFIDLDDVEIFDNYARIKISKHGKEGTKELQLVDNYFYLVQWLDKHPSWPHKKKGTPLFITLGNNSKHNRLTPKHSNKIIKNVLKELGIDKHITNYSFKRNGVTSRYKKGEAGQTIQKIAGWSSTAQLKTYDLSEQEEFFENELIEKGILKPKDKTKKAKVNYKVCAFCNEINPMSNDICSQCRRPLNREDIMKQEAKKEKQIMELQQQMAQLQKATAVLLKLRKRN